MIKPKKLEKENTIGFVAPSNYLEKDKYPLIEKAIKKINQLGYKIIWGKHAKKTDNYNVSAGTPKQRAEDINNFFKNKNINSIWCVSGGNTANEILEYLDYNLIKQNPKIFIGLSDNTVLLNAITTQTKLITIHGTDPKIGNGYFDDTYTHNEFQKNLENNSSKKIPKNSNWKCIRKGKSQGQLIGGNLRCFLKLAGTKYMPNMKNKILLIEGLETTIKDTIAQISQLKQQKNFNKIKGVIIGNIYSFDEKKQYNKNNERIYFEDIFKELTKEYNFPILKIYEAGHKVPSTFLPIGAKVQINSEKKELKIIETYLE